MNSNEEYIKNVLKFVSDTLKSKSAIEVLQEISKKVNKDLVISQEDQYLLGGILGAMLHSAYCESRKLDKPLENGLVNNPRPKKLTSEIDATFVQDVKEGKISLSPALYIDEKSGVVIMDIANTDFANLSPYWQKDNFLAGCAASRSVITCLEGIMHQNPEIRKFVEVAVANSIHEAWIARGNIYYDEYEGKIYTNRELDTAYINLPQDEKDKDLEHYKMAKSLISKLQELVKENQNSKGPTGSQPGDE